MCANVDMDVVFSSVNTFTFYDYVNHFSATALKCVITEYCIPNDSENQLQDFSCNNTFYQ